MYLNIFKRSLKEVSKYELGTAKSRVFDPIKRNFGTTSPYEWLKRSNDENSGGTDEQKGTSQMQAAESGDKSTTSNAAKTSIREKFTTNAYNGISGRKPEASSLIETISDANAFVDERSYNKQGLEKVLDTINNKFDIVLNQVQEDEPGSGLVRSETLFLLHKLQSGLLSEAEHPFMSGEKKEILKKFGDLRLSISRKLFEWRYDYTISPACKEGIDNRILQELNIPNPKDFCLVEMNVKGTRWSSYRFFYAKNGYCITTHAYKNLDGMYGKQREKPLPSSEMMVNGFAVFAKAQKRSLLDLPFTKSIIYSAINEKTYDFLARRVPLGETKTFKPGDPFFQTIERLPNVCGTLYVLKDYSSIFKMKEFTSIRVIHKEGNGQNVTGPKLDIEVNISSNDG